MEKDNIDRLSRTPILMVMMKTNVLLIAVTGLCLFSAPLSYAQQPADTNAPVRASLIDATGKVMGSAVFNGTQKGVGTQMRKGVLITVDVSGLSPGWHGTHLHATGDCSDHTDHFEKAGSHMAWEGEQHGYLHDQGPHKGDLPNLWVHGDGTGRAEFYSTVTSYDELRDADGSALMIHAAPDDHTSQPAGESGARVLCGVIGQ